MLRELLKICFPSALILLYHRVTKVQDDPLLLTVSPKNFCAQLAFLKNNFQFVTLNHLVSGLGFGRSQNNLIVVTFDDGYADNYHEALPILHALDIPATIFVTAGMVGNKKPFKWDKSGRAINLEELKKMASDPLIEIGSHTVNHPKLGVISLAEQKKEIVESKKMLEQLIKKEIKAFAYPYGREADFTKGTIKLIRQNGYQYACSATPELVWPFSNRFTLPRFIVRDWTTSEFNRRLTKFGWL